MDFVISFCCAMWPVGTSFASELGTLGFFLQHPFMALFPLLSRQLLSSQGAVSCWHWRHGKTAGKLWGRKRFGTGFCCTKLGSACMGPQSWMRVALVYRLWVVSPMSVKLHSSCWSRSETFTLAFSELSSHGWQRCHWVAIYQSQNTHQYMYAISKGPSNLHSLSFLIIILNYFLCLQTKLSAETGKTSRLERELSDSKQQVSELVKQQESLKEQLQRQEQQLQQQPMQQSAMDVSLNMGSLNEVRARQPYETSL